ncbi:MAG: ferrous iron transport protein A [Thermodesulfobacteriota bacterium]
MQAAQDMTPRCHWGKASFPATAQSFPLALAGEGETVRIVAVCGGNKLLERLRGMGIKPEDAVVVVQRQATGAVLIAKGAGRYALGGGMAHKIYVTKG